MVFRIEVGRRRSVVPWYHEEIKGLDGPELQLTIKHKDGGIEQLM
jgi:hypothetical protein